MSSVVRTITDGERFLDKIWRLIPRLIVDAKEDIEFLPLKLPKSGLCDKITSSSVIGEGIYGLVSELFFNPEIDGKSHELVGRTVSISQDKHRIFDVPLVLKRIQKTKDRNSALILGKDGIPSLFINEQLLETLATALASLLFDLGASPTLSKFFAGYDCDKNPSLIIEKLPFKLTDLLKILLSKEFTYRALHILKNLVIQVLIASYYLKHYFGLVNNDINENNILFLLLHDALGLSSKFPVSKEYVFSSLDLTQTRYWSFEIGTQTIVIQNIGLLVKLIDFGICNINLYQAQLPQFLFKLRIRPDFFNSQHMDEIAENPALDNDEIMGDVDVALFLYYLCGEISRTPGVNNLSVYISFRKFACIIIPQLTQLIPEASGNFFTHEFQKTKVFEDRFDFIGWNKDILTPINSLVKYLKDCGMVKDSNTAYFTFNGKLPDDYRDNSLIVTRQKIENNQIRFSQFTKQFKLYYDACLIGDEKQIRLLKTKNPTITDLKKLCKHQGIQAEQYSLSNFVRKPFTGQTISSSSEFITPEKALRRHSPILSDKFRIFESGNLSIYSVGLYPEVLELERITDLESFRFNLDQRLLSYQPPSKEMLGKNQNNTYMHIVIPSRVAKLEIFRQAEKYGQQESIFPTADKVLGAGQALITGSYFVTVELMKAGKVPGLSSVGKPIGYYYGYTDLETRRKKVYQTVPVPSGYIDEFAFITISEGKLSFHPYLYLLETHKTRAIIRRYHTIDDKTIEVPEYLIELENGIPLLRKAGNLFRKLQPTDYEFAFSTGPILIWDGKIKMTRKHMETSEFSHNGIRYKVYDKAKTTKKFFSAPGEDRFPYGQRSSNELQVHNILAQVMLGGELVTMFFMIEGRGFDAYGLDRAQVAELLMVLDTRYAVSLDGGAELVYRNRDTLKALIPDSQIDRVGGFMIRF